MATQRNEELNKNNVGRTAYENTERNVGFDGNAAVRLNAAPQIIPEVPQEPQKQPKKRPSSRPSHKQLQKNRQRALAMSAGELICVGIGVIILTLVAVMYLKVQTKVDTQLRDIQQLTNSVATLRLENDAKELEIKSKIDYQKIYQTAITELGMYYPGKEQILHYQTTDSEYLEMNGVIPN